MIDACRTQKVGWEPDDGTGLRRIGGQVNRRIRLGILAGVVAVVCGALTEVVYSNSQHAGLQKLEASGIWVLGLALAFAVDRATRPKP